jgi:hypothetical protein
MGQGGVNFAAGISIAELAVSAAGIIFTHLGAVAICIANEKSENTTCVAT